MDRFQSSNLQSSTSLKKEFIENSFSGAGDIIITWSRDSEKSRYLQL